MNKFSEIIEAWVVSNDPTPEQYEIAQERIEVCDSCDRRKYIRNIDIHVCGVCGCPLAKKIYVQNGEKCPLNKWER